MRFIDFADTHGKTILRVVIVLVLMTTLVLGFRCGFLNNNSQISEPMYGYGSALNHVHYGGHFFMLDVSISEKKENHPYLYIHNPDFGFLLNRFVLALGVSEENSYVYANALTALARVASLYLLYLLLMEITGSELFAVLVVILIGFDYYNFYVTHYDALRGNTFVAYVLFLFSLVRLSRCGESEGWFYIFLSIVALWMAFFIGFMTQSTLIFTMVFLALFGVTRISGDQFAKIILFGVAVPLVVRIVIIARSVGLETWVIDNWLTQSTKMGTLSTKLRCPEDLYYIFNDANLYAGWPATFFNVKDVVSSFLPSHLKAAVYYFKMTMDTATMAMFVVFLMWAAACYLIYWRSGGRTGTSSLIPLRAAAEGEATFSFTARFLAVVLLTLIINMLIFPPYYYVFEIVLGNYISLLAFTLPAAYFLSRTLHRMTLQPDSRIMMVCTAIVGLFIVAKVHNDYFFCRLLPVEKTTMFEVLKPFKGKSATSNTMKSFIYSKILERPCTFHEGLCSQYPTLFEFTPLSVGASWKVNSRDQFESYEYNFPELAIFNFNKYDLFMDDVMLNNQYSFVDLFRLKNVSLTERKYRNKKLKHVKRVLSTYGAKRILYHDEEFVIVNYNDILPPPNRMVRNRCIWDNLTSIQEKCLQTFINPGYNKEKYPVLAGQLQSEVADKSHLGSGDDIYARLYRQYVESVGLMNNPTLAREALADCFSPLKSDYISNRVIIEGNMTFGHMLLLALIVNYQVDDIQSMTTLFEKYYCLLPLQLRRYALALRILAMERDEYRDVWKYKLYKRLYKRMLYNRR